VKSQFARFLAVGAVAAIANIGSRIVFNIWMGFVPAMTLAFVVGLLTAFVLNRNWVFLSRGNRWLNEAGWFVLVNLVGLGQTIGISWLLARYVLPSIGQTALVPETAHSIGVIIPVATSYLGHKYFTFKRHD